MTNATGPGGSPRSGSSPGQKSGRTADLGVRIVSAAVLAPIVLGAVWFGGWIFVGLAAIAAAILVSEWSGISRGRFVDNAVVVGGVAAVTAVVALASGFGGLSIGILLIGACVAGALAWRSDPARLFGFGVIYGGLPAMALVLIRSDPAYGLIAIVWLLVLVWASDIGGYVFGRLLGGPKLAPRISPKKTWTGFIGGLAAAVLASLAFDAIAIPGGTIPIWLAAGLSTVSQAGDLVESAFKRRFGAKDSSRLIPGHGGLMDRIDGLVVVAAVAAAIGLARGGMQAAGAGLVLW
jgi:phosphatidate cytidylyltransferase